MPSGVYLHKPLSAETKQRISQANLGHPTSVETRQKISATLLGHPTSEETRKRIGSSRIYPSGKDNPAWKGGKIIDGGYVYILNPSHPRADSGGYVRRADLVMEQVLGRLLTSGEIVDHKNRIRDDDRPENLRLFANQSAHMSFHAEAGDCFPLDGSGGIPFRKGYDARRLGIKESFLK